MSEHQELIERLEEVARVLRDTFVSNDPRTIRDIAAINAAIEALQQPPQPDDKVKNLAMMVRRMAAKLRVADCEKHDKILKEAAAYLEKIGEQGSILRLQESESQPVGGVAELIKETHDYYWGIRETPAHVNRLIEVIERLSRENAELKDGYEGLQDFLSEAAAQEGAVSEAMQKHFREMSGESMTPEEQELYWMAQNLETRKAQLEAQSQAYKTALSKFPKSVNAYRANGEIQLEWIQGDLDSALSERQRIQSLTGDKQFLEGGE